MRILLQSQPFRNDYEPFTLYLDGGEIAVRPFWHRTGEASLGWVWTDGVEWSASMPWEREVYTIRQADAQIARGSGDPTRGPIRWRIDLLGTRRVLSQHVTVCRKPGCHARITLREDDTGTALAVAISSWCRMRIAIRPAGMALAPALVGMIMITNHSHPYSGS